MVGEIHIHLPAGLPDEEVIHVYLDAPGDYRLQPEQAAATGDERAIAARLTKMEHLPSASPKLREFVGELLTLGYTIRMPKGAEQYLRFMDPSAPAHGAGYIRANSITFTRGQDRQALIRLGRGNAHSHGVRFTIDGGHALEAAKLVKRH